MVGMKAGVHDELDRLCADLTDRFNDLTGESSRAGIDDECALWRFGDGPTTQINLGAARQWTNDVW